MKKKRKFIKVLEENVGEFPKSFEPGKNLPSNTKIKNHETTGLYIQVPKYNNSKEFCIALKLHKQKKRINNKLGKNIYVTELIFLKYRVPIN